MCVFCKHNNRILAEIEFATHTVSYLEALLISLRWSIPMTIVTVFHRCFGMHLIFIGDISRHKQIVISCVFLKQSSEPLLCTIYGCTVWGKPFQFNPLHLIPTTTEHQNSYDFPYKLQQIIFSYRGRKNYQSLLKTWSFQKSWSSDSAFYNEIELSHRKQDIW